jgi:hypothetical protein
MSATATKGPDYEVVLRGEEVSRITRAEQWADLPHRYARVRLVYNWSDVSRRAKRDLYVLIQQSALLNEQEVRKARRSTTAGEKRFLVLPDDSPLEALPALICGLSVRSPSRLHTPRLEVDDLRSFVHRFVAALSRWPTGPTIADAWLEGDSLVVLSPTLERLKVPVRLLPKLANAAQHELEQFEIDDEGEFLYWPTHDVHMGWPQFEQLVKPAARLRAEQASETFNKRYGQCIRRFRQEAGLRQSDIKGLDERTVRRIEQGDTRATSRSLRKLAKAHGLALNEYLDRLASRLEPDSTS